MTIPSIATPARPTDDAIIATPWGTWAHDYLAAFPVLQTMQFSIVYASGGATKTVPYLEPYPAGWTVVLVGAGPGAVTGNTSPDKWSVLTPGLSSVGVRAQLGTYTGSSGPWWVTVAGFAPGVTPLLWRHGTVTPTTATAAEVAEAAEAFAALEAEGA